LLILRQEKYGFGNIAQQPTQSAWLRIWNKSTWAMKLMNSVKQKTKAKTKSRNTESLVDSMSALNHVSSDSPSINNGKNIAFDSDRVFALSNLLAVYLYRWKSGQTNSPSMQLLSALSFFNGVSRGDSESTSMSLVEFLWTILQESEDIEKYADVL